MEEAEAIATDLRRHARTEGAAAVDQALRMLAEDIDAAGVATATIVAARDILDAVRQHAELDRPEDDEEGAE